MSVFDPRPQRVGKKDQILGPCNTEDAGGVGTSDSRIGEEDEGVGGLESPVYGLKAI